ncbi:MAG: hypothetical protein ACI9EF_003555, partial [Pseudohongiellaceae bacterium]
MVPWAFLSESGGQCEAELDWCAQQSSEVSPMWLLALLFSSLLLLTTPAPSLRLVELTGDSLADKLLIGADGSLSVAVNRGAGSFVTIVPGRAGLPATLGVVDVLVTDLNGDGHADLSLTCTGDNRALLGDGIGGLVDGTDAVGLADGARGLSAERMDLDGFGDEEVVLHNGDSDVIFWSRGWRFERDGETPPATSQGAAPLAEELEQILSHLSLVWLGDGLGGLRKTIRITGANLQIVSGSRATNGYPADSGEVDTTVTTSNGLGNLIIGYDEVFPFRANDRTGSHNLVIGKWHTYTSFGGLIGGDTNRVTAPYSTVAGGFTGLASGLRSSVLGGEEGEATGYAAAVLGGAYNRANGFYATSAGGAYNSVEGHYAHVCAGEMNVATGQTSSVAGGAQMLASGVSSTAVSGAFGHASGFTSAVVGGENNIADGDYSVVVGGSD